MQYLKYIILSSLLFTLCLGDCLTQTTCQNNEQCSGTTCTRCVVSSTSTNGYGTCQRGLSLGDPCVRNSDCDASSDATVCIRGVCSQDPTKPDAPCQNNFQCNSQIYSRCNGTNCVQAQNCGGTCKVDTDCSTVYSCKWCLNGICHSQCNSPCQEDGQCGDPGCGSCKALNSAYPNNKVCTSA